MQLELGLDQLYLVPAITYLFNHADNIKFVVLLRLALVYNAVVLVICLVAADSADKLDSEAKSHAQSPHYLLNSLFVVCALFLKKALGLLCLAHFVQN